MLRARAELMSDLPSLDRRFVARGRIVTALVVLLLAIQAVRGFLPPDADARVVLALAFIPASWTRLFDPHDVAGAAALLVSHDWARVDELILLLGPNGPRWWTPLTYAFLHGGWTHVIVNCVWLAAFGSAVARRFGALRFTFFYAVTAAAGALTQCLVHPFDFGPLVGASAAISGAMAGAARFAFAPGGPLGPGARRSSLDAYLGPAVPLHRLFRDKRVLMFVVIWFVANLLFGAFITPAGLGDATIAWEAHIGGFLSGLLLFRLFDPVQASGIHDERPETAPDVLPSEAPSP